MPHFILNLVDLIFYDMSHPEKNSVIIWTPLGFGFTFFFANLF